MEQAAELAGQPGAPLRAAADRRHRLAQPVRRGRLPRGRLRAPQLGEDLGALAGVVGLLERAAQVARRRLRGAAAHRVGGGRAERADHLGTGAGAGLQRVRGDALGRRAGGAQDPHRGAMGRGALAGVELLVDRPAEDRVRERDAAVARVEDPRAAQRGHRAAGRVDRHAGQRGHPVGRRAVAEDRQRARHGARLRRQAAQRELHRARHGRRADLAHALDARGDRRDALLRERGQQLDEQERVAAGRAMARRRERAAPRPPRASRRAGAVAASLSGPGRTRPGRGLGGELAEQRRVAAELAGAQGGDERDRQVLEAPGEVRDEPQRQLVGPVGVVDDEQQRRLLGEVRREPVQPVQERVGRALPRPLAGRRRLEAEQLRRQPRAALQQPPPLGRRGRAQAALEQLARDAEGELALELAAAAGEHLEAALARTVARGVQQRRLAQARGRLDEHQPTGAAAGGVERFVDDLDLGIPFEQLAQRGLTPRLGTLVPRPLARSRRGQPRATRS